MNYDEIACNSIEEEISTATALKQYLAKDLLTILQLEKTTLQGGGALTHIYGSPRMSADLDFVHDLPKTELRKNLEEKLKNYTSKKHFQCEMTYSFANPGNTRLTRAKLKAKTPLGEINALSNEFYKVPVYQSSKKQIIGTTQTIQTESATEIIADKMCATISRQKTRGAMKISDLFDIWHLRENADGEIDRQLIVQKCKDYQIGDIEEARKQVIEKLKIKHAIIDALKNTLQIPKSKKLTIKTYQKIVEVSQDAFKNIE